MSLVDFVAGWRGKALHGVVASTQEHRAEQVDTKVKPQIQSLGRVAVTGLDSRNASFESFA